MSLDAKKSPGLILAIQPDRRQASQLASIARRMSVELVLMESAEPAIAALGARLPDLILTPPLLSQRDVLALTERLRQFGRAADHVQTLTIPILAVAQPPASDGLLSPLRNKRQRKEKKGSVGPIGCDADTFAEEIAIYLTRAVQTRTAQKPGRASSAAVAAAPSATPEDFAQDDSGAFLLPAAAEDSQAPIAPSRATHVERLPAAVNLPAVRPIENVVAPAAATQTSMDAFVGAVPLVATRPHAPLVTPQSRPPLAHLPAGLPDAAPVLDPSAVTRARPAALALLPAAVPDAAPTLDPSAVAARRPAALALLPAGLPDATPALDPSVVTRPRRATSSETGVDAVTAIAPMVTAAAHDGAALTPPTRTPHVTFVPEAVHPAETNVDQPPAPQPPEEPTVLEARTAVEQDRLSKKKMKTPKPSFFDPNDYRFSALVATLDKLAQEE